MVHQKSLEKLLGRLEYTHLQGPAANEVNATTVVTDSRQVSEGSVFIALKGDSFDGHDFISSAAALGCAAIIVEQGSVDRETVAALDVAVYAVQSTREALAGVVAQLYDNPQDDLTLVGITGTNGKTTITYLLEKVLRDQGEQVGVIGTVSYRYTDRDGVDHESAAPLTTPDPVILQKMLRQMADAGVSTVLMEASSHALVQQRLDGISFDIAAFTNLSHDHLDYHHSMEEYFQAKSLLFLNHLNKSGKAVVTFTESDEVLNNTWPTALERLLQQHDINYVTCGRVRGSAVQPLSVEIKIDRTIVSLQTSQGELRLVSPLVGRFNVDNILTTVAIASVLGLDISRTITSLAAASGAPGRLERVLPDNDEKPQTMAFVDYAHTPDALLNVLKTLKALPHKRLICVFGCGGDRDTAKRPEMGKIAAQLADIAIVTDDNPRTERSEQIITHILEGVCSTGKEKIDVDRFIHSPQADEGYLVIADRSKAIRCAIHSAGDKDIVVIAGKGHEKYQLTNEGKRFFDDCLEVREAFLAWDVDSVAQALGVEPDGVRGHGRFQGVCTDTRALRKGELFIALKGDSFDGHDYVFQAAKAGAGGLVVADMSFPEDIPDLPVYRVDDTLKALGRLAGFKRRCLAQISAPTVIGITGSTGKTTVKEMVSAIFHKQWPDCDTAPLGRVLKTKGNFNNLIGLPLSLLPLELKHRVAILEMGMNMPGEIAQLAGIADPDISCIVNVHGAHLEGLGSIEGVAREKAQLFAGTKKQGTLVVNLDDPRVAAAASQHDHEKICYTIQTSSAAPADLYVSEVSCRDDGNMSFTLHTGETASPVNLGVPGTHNVANALAAAAIAHAAGVSTDVIVSGLESFTAADKRLQIFKAAAGYSIINDTYNANPASMKAGLATLGSMPGTMKIAVLSDMLELGESGADAHFDVGQSAGQIDIAFLLLVGNFTKEFAAGALAAGMEESKIKTFATKEEISEWIKKLEAEAVLSRDSWIFVKASRGMRLETVVEDLVAK